MRNKLIFYFLIPSLIILGGFVPYFIYYDRVPGFDWGFFNSMNLLYKSVILEYHRFPIHDPWVFGGLDILSRPQNWVFSPFIISTLILPPYAANLFSLILMSFIGFWAMYKLLKYYGVSDIISIFCALLFVNASWFGQHMAEGHIAFRTLFLLPLVIYLVLTLENIKKFIALSLLMAFFLIDGGIYTFAYSLVLIFLLMILNMVPLRPLFSDITKYWFYYILTTAAFISVSSAKLIPVLNSLALKERIEQYHMTLKQIAISLFFPIQTNLYIGEWLEDSASPSLRFNEYGCYIGLISLLAILWYARNKTFLKNNIKEILLMGFFLWLATGFGGDFNPGTLLKKIPLIKNTHVESRYFVVFMIFYIIILARVLNRGVISKLLLILILVVLNTEYLLVKNFPATQVLTKYYNQIEYPKYITKRKITKTIYQGQKPEIYIEDNIASKDSYEAILPGMYVKHIEEEDYKGEVYPLDTKGSIEVLEYSPGFINAKYDLEKPGTIVFNTSSLNSWVVNEPHEVVENETKLLTVSVPEKKGVLYLHFQPHYLKKVFVLFVSGIIIYMLLIWRFYLRNDT